MTNVRGNQIRVTICPYMEEFLQEASEILNCSKAEAHEKLLETIEVLARNDRLDIGLQWSEAMERVNARGLGRTKPKPAEPEKTSEEVKQKLEGEILLHFDVKLLETSNKGKSGYEGVYANGKGWRAMVPLPTGGGAKFLLTRPTPIIAAIDRFRYYEEHALPYGPLGKMLDRMVRREMLDFETAIIEAAKFVHDIGGDAVSISDGFGYTIAQCADLLKRYRQKIGRPDTGLGELDRYAHRYATPEEQKAREDRLADSRRKRAEMGLGLPSGDGVDVSKIP